MRAILGWIAAFGFLLNLPWEFLQTPLYAQMPAAPHWAAIKVCTRAAVGDALILVATYISVALVAAYPRWILRARPWQLAAWCAQGLVITVMIEWLALRGAWLGGGWQYSDAMPLVPGLGVGASPLAQWLLLPPLVAFLVQRVSNRASHG